jgi:prefoldin subunit 5
MKDIQKEIEQYTKELAELEKLDSSFSAFIDKLIAELLLIRQLMEQVNSWKSGMSQEAFMNNLENYFRTYTQKLNELEKTYAEIGNAKKRVRSLIHNAIIKSGPAF